MLNRSFVTNHRAGNRLCAHHLCVQGSILIPAFSAKTKRPRLRSEQGLVKGEKFCFRNLDFYFRHGESTSIASQLTSQANQKSKDLNEVPLAGEMS